GKTLSLSMSSVLSLNPDIPECHKLQGWFSTQTNTRFEPVSQRTGGMGGGAAGNLLLMREIQDQQLGMGDKADYCSVRGIIQVFRGSNTTYKACPSQDCNKKVRT
ncbi:replication protein A 70 kDa DNA-binding subunit-like, partial [Diaphorina citri]|uniref:Replication protein A 70 kDa DNA-binding subunit-like n=1 Tax=Diaphorina citri TaxID=121845 RepID=A0A1S3DQW6_DIACI